MTPIRVRVIIFHFFGMMPFGKSHSGKTGSSVCNNGGITPYISVALASGMALTQYNHTCHSDVNLME